MIFVTGGTGFVGKQVVRKLLESSQQMRLLVRNPSSHLLDHRCLTFAGGDILDFASLKSGMSGCEKVIHLVGIISETKGETLEKVHIEGTRNVIQAAKENGIKKIIHMSALGTRKTARSRYHKTKWEAEEIVRKSGIPYVIFRPSIIIGLEDKFVNFFARMMRSFPGTLGVMPVIGNGKNKFQPVWVPDVAECLAKAALDEKIANKEYALTGADALTYDELLDAIMQVLNIKRFKIHIPISVAYLFASFLEKFPNPVLNRDQVMMLEEDNTGNNENMKQDFKINPKHFKEVIQGYLK